MIAAPAIDLREGRCVQWVGGRPEEERVSLPDPLEVAERWAEAGFRTLHVVDLDAALGRGDNDAPIRALLSTWSGEVQVGGGVRDARRVSGWLDAGASRVVVGTRGVRDPAWLRRTAGRHPGRILLAADVRERSVLVRGWTERADLSLDELLGRVDDLPLAGVLCTDVGREGRMEGVDRALQDDLVRGTGLPVWRAGGITTVEDLSALDAARAAGAVLGMALYTGQIDAREVAERWGGRGSNGEDDRWHD